MAYWFVFALLFLDGKILNKFFAVLLANMVVIFSSTLIPSSVSAILRSEMTTLYSQKSFIRLMTILMVQLCIFYFCSLILKLIDKALLKLKKKRMGINNLGICNIVLLLIMMDKFLTGSKIPMCS